MLYKHHVLAIKLRNVNSLGIFGGQALILFMLKQELFGKGN